MARRKGKTNPEELKLELRRKRRYYGAPISYRKLREMVADVISRVTTESESKRLKIDGRCIFRIGGGIFDLAVKCGNFQILFLLEDDGRAAYVLTLSRLGRYYPNLIRSDSDAYDLTLIKRMIDELAEDKNFRMAEEVVEV